MEKCNEIATKILKNSGMAIASAMRSINANYKSGVNGYDVEIEEFGKCFGTEDFKTGTQAFLNKEKANFRK
jgi:enoyl-CoA hydratase